MDSPAMRNQSNGRAVMRIGIVTLVLVGVVYSVLEPIYWRLWYRVNQSTSQNRLKDMALALQLYSKDSNDVLPPVFVVSDKVGWAGALHPYIKPTMTGPITGSWPFECPYDATRHNESPSKGGFSDYWYNANVMRKTPRGVVPARLAQLKSPSQMVLVGCAGSEKPGTGFDASFNQCGDGTALTGPSQTCGTAPIVDVATYPNAKHALDGTDFLFADGHVKWLRGNNASQSAQILNNGATLHNIGGKVTFSLLNKRTDAP